MIAVSIRFKINIDKTKVSKETRKFP